MEDAFNLRGSLGNGIWMALGGAVGGSALCCRRCIRCSVGGPIELTRRLLCRSPSALRAAESLGDTLPVARMRTEVTSWESDAGGKLNADDAGDVGSANVGRSLLPQWYHSCCAMIPMHTWCATSAFASPSSFTLLTCCTIILVLLRLVI